MLISRRCHTQINTTSNSLLPTPCHALLLVHTSQAEETSTCSAERRLGLVVPVKDGSSQLTDKPCDDQPVVPGAFPSPRMLAFSFDPRKGFSKSRQHHLIFGKSYEPSLANKDLAKYTS